MRPHLSVQGSKHRRHLPCFQQGLGRTLWLPRKTGTALDHINRCRTWNVRDNHPIFVLFQITPVVLCAVLKTTIEGGDNIKTRECLAKTSRRWGKIKPCHRGNSWRTGQVLLGGMQDCGNYFYLFGRLTLRKQTGFIRYDYRVGLEPNFNSIQRMTFSKIKVSQERTMEWLSCID